MVRSESSLDIYQASARRDRGDKPAARALARKMKGRLYVDRDSREATVQCVGKIERALARIPGLPTF